DRGQVITLLCASVSPSPWTEITWEVTLDSALTYRIVTFNKGEPPDFGPSPYFINRVTFHPENLSLQIDPVKKSDSGLYTLIIDTGGGRENRTKFRVSVFDRVRHPNLTVLSAHAELGQCNVTLSCSVPGADRATYDWYQGTSRIPSDRDHQLPGHQSLLHVVINADSSDVFYRCNASNRASWDADTVDVKSLCDFPCLSALAVKWRGGVFLHGHRAWEPHSGSRAPGARRCTDPGQVTPSRGCWEDGDIEDSEVRIPQRWGQRTLARAAVFSRQGIDTSPRSQGQFSTNHGFGGNGEGSPKIRDPASLSFPSSFAATSCSPHRGAQCPPAAAPSGRGGWESEPAPHAPHRGSFCPAGLGPASCSGRRHHWLRLGLAAPCHDCAKPELCCEPGHQVTMPRT
uniref:Ig-like domain-containing protein n=1 Tax=Chrysemys picta bellii TaxID=8478 RepID=A0A8C3ISM7_CHRPI